MLAFRGHPFGSTKVFGHPGPAVPLWVQSFSIQERHRHVTVTYPTKNHWNKPIRAQRGLAGMRLKFSRRSGGGGQSSRRLSGGH
jgi:hypothetical protein